MGGKQKQAQRTKNNARPSSSSRSAEILGTNIPGFVGFSANRDGGYNTVLPGFSSVENFDANIDPNIQIVFKKMAKKDPVTKLKALNEFTTYINSVEEEVICGTLSFWPRMYSQLSADCNHRVREVTQIAHSALVAKCGRSIAPYLKQLVPVWLTSQYDTYMPAKVQAKEAFDKVFPSKKVPEVMTFCRNEIFDYISDNLILHTATTLSNPKLFTPEECESIYERTVVMSLQGYEYFLNNLPDEHLEWLYERQVKILDNKKFWELRNQKSSLIKSRLFAVIGCLCRRLTKWFTPKYGKKACELLFSQLSEKDFELLVSIWENMILLMAYVPNWGEYVDIENYVLVHIFNVLSDGGRNCATGIGPLLLPLLVHLSSIKKENITDFYSKFLNSICIGLEQRWVMSSKSGCNAWLSGLVECLIHISNLDTETDINSQVLSQSIRSWLKTAIEPKTFSSSFNFVKLNAAHLTDVSILWTKNSLMDNGTKSNTFTHLIRIFWQNFLFVITSQIDNMTVDDSEVKKITDLHLELLMGLKNASNNKKKLTSHVKFTIDHIGNDQNNVSDEKIEPVENVDIMQHFQQSLNKSTHEICARYILYAKVKNISAPILNPLNSIVREFDSLHLHCCMSQTITKDSNAKAMKLYTDWYSNWLKSDSMRSQAVVDLSFALLVHLAYEDQMIMLKSFNQLSLPVIKWCISRCISHPYSTNTAVCEWLLSNTVHESLIALSKLVVTHGDKRHVDLLKMCFAHTDGGNILISKNTCSSIVNIFENSLYSIDSDHLNICAAFASHLAAAISSNMNESEDYTKLLLSLFTLNVNTQNNTDVLIEDISMEVNSSWRDALSTLSDENVNLFIKNSSLIILNKLLKSNELNIATINSLVNISLNLIDSCKSIDVSNDNNSNYSYDVMITLLKIDYDEVKPAIDKIMLLALVTDIINGKLYCSSSDSPMMKEFTHDTKNIRIADLNACDLNKILSWLLFSMEIVESVMNSKNDYENLNVIDKPDGSEIVLNVLHYIAAIKTLYVEYKAWNWFSDMAKLFDPLMTSTINTINNLTDKNYQTLYDSVKKKFQQEGFYWTICLYMCEHNLRISKSITCHGSEIDVILNNLIEKLDADNFEELLSIEFYHNLQVLKNEGHIKENDDLDMKVACLLAMRSIYLTHFANKPKIGDIHFEIEEFKSGITSPLISLTTIIDIYYVHKELMLYDEDISSVAWDAVNCNTSIIRFLTTCINISGWELESHHWDFITISVSSFIQSIDKSKKGWDSPKVALLGTAVFELYCSVSKFISTILPESISREPTQALLQLLDEWRDLFAPDMHHHIFEIFMSIFKDCAAPERTISPLSILFITSLHDVMQAFQWIHIKNKYSEKILIDSFQVCLDIMASPSHHILKYMASTILKGLTPLMIEYDKLQGVKSNTATEENPQIEPVPVHLSVHIIEPTLINIQGCMEAVLNPYKIGEDNCILLPYTDSHSIALGYLFLWEVLLDIAQESTAYLQHEYSEFFKEGQYVEQLLNVLFRLLPAELSEQSKFLNYFKIQPVLSYKEPINWDLVSRLACHRLLRCLHGGWLGVFVRGWWGSLPTRSSQHVERIVQSHVSPLLIASQLSGVSKQQNNIPNIELNIHPSVNEVVCVYVIEDLKMGLTIQLCKNHPLNKPRVISSGTPINNMTWLSMYLSHQNGSVYQAIKMWANAVQKKIESTPVCYVCYCRLHPTTGQLPKMLCQTCKNKFHNVCLYRWFSTSGKTTCPMCRNLFNV